MNCFILILLLSCCGRWGNSCGANNNWLRDNACGRDCGRDCSGRKPFMGEACERMADRKPEECGCGCQERGKEDCDCERDRKESCDIGMIPSPWQDYPRFPHHDDNEECEA